MIWKIATGVLGVGLLLVLLFDYVPALKKLVKGSEASQATLTDSIKSITAKQVVVNSDLAKKNQELGTIHQAEQRSEDRRAAIVPEVTLHVQRLTALQQRQQNLENLVKNHLLVPIFNGVTGPDHDGGTLDRIRFDSVWYSPRENTAMTIALQVYDSLKVADSLLRLEHADLQYRYKVRGDTSTARAGWISQEVSINRKKGWFTGKNRERASHLRQVPN